jgi:ATP-dependent RNA helicase CshB
MQYLNYEIKDYIANALNDLHFKDFSEVQRNVFDNLNKGRNLLVKSKTGSGKTHAFLIPIFNALDLSKKEVQAVIVSPTKELADQTYKVAQHIASFCDKEIKIKSYSGGQDRLKDLEDLEANQPQIVIGTPGRIKDLAVDKNALKIYTSKFYIIDEVDMVMSEGFTDDVDAITKIVPDARKMFFSATLNEILIPFVKSK